MATIYPELIKSTSYNEETWTELREALKVCWNTVPTTFFKLLLESMPRRIKACLDDGIRSTKALKIEPTIDYINITEI